MKNRVISFHYTLKDKDGKTLDSSQNGHPMTYMEGSGQIIPGLESQLTGASVGDKKSVTVEAAQAYGTYQKELLIEIERSQFPKSENIKVGDRFRAGQDGDEHPAVFTVTGVSDTHVKLDGNHPLAGQDLFFEVEVTEVRDATPEEVAHGHAHGPHGHHHH